MRSRRRTSRLSLVEVGRALRVHPRTVRRWELGQTRPRESQWLRLIAFFADHAPKSAETLAAAAGRPMPRRAPVAGPLVATRVVARAADALDVAPGRVREVLRAAAEASAEAGAGIELVVQALMSEPT